MPVVEKSVVAENKLPPKRGVYVLANDAVIEAFLALVHSLRRHDPELPVTVIPYNDALAELRKLAPQLRFDILDEAPCRRFDALAQQVNGSPLAAGMFRKHAAFAGPYDEFIYLDADIVVTSSLQEILTAFAASPYDLVYFDPDMSQVYLPELAAQMIATHQAQGFNAGVFVARKGLVSDADRGRLAPEAAQLRDQLKVSAIDQPFLNYTMHRLRRRLALITELFPTMSSSVFATVPFRFDRRSGRATLPDGKSLPLIHWAGYNYPYYIIRPEVYLACRTLNLNFVERLRCRWDFYRRHHKRKLRNALAKFPPTAQLVQLRERWKKV